MKCFKCERLYKRFSRVWVDLFKFGNLVEFYGFRMSSALLKSGNLSNIVTEYFFDHLIYSDHWIFHTFLAFINWLDFALRFSLFYKINYIDKYLLKNKLYIKSNFQKYKEFTF